MAEASRHYLNGRLILRKLPHHYFVSPRREKKEGVRDGRMDLVDVYRVCGLTRQTLDVQVKGDRSCDHSVPGPDIVLNGLHCHHAGSDPSMREGECDGMRRDMSVPWC